MERPTKRFERIPLVEVRKLLGAYASAGERDAVKDPDPLWSEKSPRKNMAAVNYEARAAADNSVKKRSS